MRIVQCTYARHAIEILNFFNDAILTSTALYDYKVRPAESMVGWFSEKEAGCFPVIGAEAPSGELIGFASYGSFRRHPAYKYTVEHSVYVHRNHRREGVGLKLMRELIAAAQAQNYHVMVGAIDVQNAVSIALHEKLGFTHAGTIRHTGFKFGRWLDLAFYQIILDMPATPVDG